MGGGVYFHSRRFSLFVTLNLPLQDTRIIRAIIHQTPFTQRITTEHHKIRYFQRLISFNLRLFSKAGPFTLELGKVSINLVQGYTAKEESQDVKPGQTDFTVCTLSTGPLNFLRSGT